MVYYTYHKYHYSSNDEYFPDENAYSYIPDDGFLPEAAKLVIALISGHDRFQGPTEKPVEGGPNIYITPGHGIDSYDDVRAEWIFIFDKEYGAGAYFKSQKAARRKHSRIVSSKLARFKRENSESAPRIPVSRQIEDLLNANCKDGQFSESEMETMVIEAFPKSSWTFIRGEVRAWRRGYVRS